MLFTIASTSGFKKTYSSWFFSKSLKKIRETRIVVSVHAELLKNGKIRGRKQDKNSSLRRFELCPETSTKNVCSRISYLHLWVR
jgi:hypothetical protein